MKKFITVAFTVLLLLSLVACSTPAAPEESLPPSAEASAAPDSAQTPAEDDENAVSTQMIYGKVKSLVGNEMTLDLAKQPEDAAMAPDGGSEGAAGVGKIETEAGGHQTITYAQSDEVGDVSSESGDGSSDTKIFSAGEDGSMIQINPEDMPKIDLEYTGETKDLTIPAGLQIYDLMGNEIKMADLKEGNVLMIVQSDDGSIESIMVME